MTNLIALIKKKVNGAIISLTATGVILLILAVLIVWTDYILRLIIALAIIIIAGVFFGGAYKIWFLKKEIEKYFKL